ncbi:MAG: aminotransferase class V-fold PLP-dependent enzyme [Phycisphaerae bacterium]|nr:aminotransferase class V-fold PLP-dependent enzyme [Phycisphaerae bacterium]
MLASLVADLTRTVPDAVPPGTLPVRGQMVQMDRTNGEWSIDPTLTFLNHGSYGAVPRAALKHQADLRTRLERDPVRFYKTDLEPLLDEMRSRLGSLLNCRPSDLAPLPNATIALCTILQNTRLEPGDEILITDHEYQSLSNELERVVARTGAVVVRASFPFPISDPAVVTERFLGCLSPRTRIAFISHITSCTSLVFPVAEIVRECNRRGIDICVDGAHSPGQVPVDIAALKPTYFVFSGHKWLSGPKGTGFLYVRSDRQVGFRPLQISSRAHKVRPERALFLRDFDYQGTADYSGVLTVPVAAECMGRLLPGGWPALMRQNHELIMKGRGILASALADIPGCCVETAPERMIGCMITIIVPEPPEALANRPTNYDDALQDALFERHRIVTPVWRFGATNARVVRVSAQVYNTPSQFEHLGDALAEELAREAAGRA